MKNLFNLSAKIIFLAITLSNQSCKDKDITPEVTTATDTEENTASNGDINEWIYEVMQDAYYWYDHLPLLRTLNTSAVPERFFEQLVYDRVGTDRFSMVTDNIHQLQDEFDGVIAIFGINYTIAYLDQTNNTDIGLFISYVVKDSPAEKAGIHRGDVVTGINNIRLTANNYSSLLSGNETLTFSRSELLASGQLSESTSVTLTKTSVQESPIAYQAVIDKSAYGKKIGYLVYNQFLPGDENQYDDQLRTIFGSFEQAGVNELVLDLRFNPGGYISSSGTLRSLIGKGANTSKVYYKEEWNNKYQAYFRRTLGEASLEYHFLDEANNIGDNLSRVFILTSNGTASASEMIINGLKPYMEVITIGENTYGKNMFGTLVEDDEERWDWGLYLMLGKITNANGESDYGTSAGISPTYYVEDSQVPYQPFGSDNETLFSKALEIMGIPTGTTARISPSTIVRRIDNESYRDGLVKRNKEMIRRFPQDITP